MTEMPSQPSLKPGEPGSLLSLDAGLQSALGRSYGETSVFSDAEVDNWIDACRAHGTLQVQPKPLPELSGWELNPKSGNIVHLSGKFFTLTGLHVRHRSRSGEIEWDQPIIDQPEVGILGILAKEIDGVLHFCLQAKEEPGNLPSVQLSPTVQATYSNYTQSHGGRRPLFIDYFLQPLAENILYAKLQSEDGGRFLYKSNRNLIVRVARDELIDLPSEFIWLTLRQITRLLRRDNLVHATTRSVLCGLLLSKKPGFLETEPFCLQHFLRTVQWFDDQAAANHFWVKRVGLKTLEDWYLDADGAFSHRQQRFFRVIGLKVGVAGREVAGGWEQPILHNPEIGIIGLLMQKQAGERHFLMQAKAEPGNRTGVQLGPTVQFTPGNYLGNEKLPKPYLFDEFIQPRQLTLLGDSLLAEEGARFFHETHRHRILALPEGETLQPPPEYRWISESEVRFFLTLGRYVNSCARSILACAGQYEAE